MSDASPAVFGADFQRARSFEVAFAAGAATAATALAGGSYEVTASGADCYLAVSTSAAVAAPAALPGTQPASANTTIRLFAGKPRAFDVPQGSTFYFSARGPSGAGTLTFNGPTSFSANR